MSKTTYCIGIDISAKTFAASIYQSPEQTIITNDALGNNPDGFTAFIQWLKEHTVTRTNALVCMEATGVYSEALAYYLNTHGFKVVIESPLKVKRAFNPSGHKTDASDSKQIAEYAYRFSDELSLWHPRDEILEKIKQLLSAREQFTKQKVATMNALYSYKKHVIQVPMLMKAQQETIKQLRRHIDNIDKELRNLIKQDPDISHKSGILKSVPGFGLLLTSNIMALSGALEDIQNPKSLAAFIGIVPYKYESGSSVRKKPRCRAYGPKYAKKLLRLAAQSVATHDETFRKYYLRKVSEGKAKALVLNNIANKLLKIAYSMIKNNNPYIKNYQSIHPMHYKIA